MWTFCDNYIVKLSFTALSSGQFARREHADGVSAAQDSWTCPAIEVNDHGEHDKDLWSRNSAFHFAGALQTSRPDSFFKWCL